MLWHIIPVMCAGFVLLMRDGGNEHITEKKKSIGGNNDLNPPRNYYEFILKLLMEGSKQL